MIPDYIAPLVGYRSWDVAGNGILSGLAAAQPWRPKRAMHAVCNGHSATTRKSLDAHLSPSGEWLDAPVMACVCGIYATKQPDYFKSHPVNANPFNRVFNEPCGVAVANGEVWLWGRIVEHATGYRAEYAYPKSLTVIGSPEAADAVRRMYGVPVTHEAPPPSIDDWGSNTFISGSGGGGTSNYISGISYSFSVGGGGGGMYNRIVYPLITAETPEEKKARRKAEAAERNKQRNAKQKRGWKLQPWD